MSTHEGLPVPGYKPQTDMRIALVTANKVLEERTLRVLDDLARGGLCDARWLATGRTDIEKGWMAVNRSIFQPGRVAMLDEEEPNGLELAARWHEQQAAEYEEAGTPADLAQAEHHRRYAREVRDIDKKTIPHPVGSIVMLSEAVQTPLGTTLPVGLEGTVIEHVSVAPGSEGAAKGLVAVRFPSLNEGVYLIPRVKLDAAVPASERPSDA